MPTHRLAPVVQAPSRRQLVLASLAASAAALVASPRARAETIPSASGLWTSPSGDYLVVLQDIASGTSFALQVSAGFDSLRVWAGSGSASTLNLQSLANPSDKLSVTISGNSMSGSLTLGGVQQAFSANLALAWVASEYAGVWQKASPANAYLVFCVLNTGGARLGVQIDVSINADKTYAYDVFTGSLAGTQFNGVSVLGNGRTSRITFSGLQLNGEYASLGQPRQTTPYSATHIVKTAG